MKKIVLTIGGTSVSGALVEVSKNPNEKPTILRSAHESAALGSAYDPANVYTQLSLRIAAVAQTLGTAESAEVEVCLMAPFTISQVNIIKDESAEPKKLSSKDLASIVENAKNNFVSTHGSALASLAPGESVALDAVLLGSLINGYHISDPVGLAGKTRELHILTTATSGTLRDTIEKAIQSSFLKQTEIHYSSFARVAPAAFLQALPELNSGSIINVGSTHSEALMVWNGILADHSLIALGADLYLREVGKALSLDPTQTLSALRLYTEGGATPEASARIAEASRAVREQWIQTFTQIAHTAMEEYFLPDHVCIVSNESVISEALTRAFGAELSRLSFSDSSFSFINIRESLGGAFVFGNNVTPSSSLMLVSLFYATLERYGRK